MINIEELEVFTRSFTNGNTLYFLPLFSDLFFFGVNGVLSHNHLTLSLPLHSNGDDEPDGQVAGHIAQHDGKLTDPVARVLKVKPDQLRQPEP